MEYQKQLLFGAAYYDEYMPYERLDEDMKMMQSAGFNVIRIAESTWSVLEPRPGEYDFSSVDRVIEAAARYDIRVIIGTPTYAVPAWLAALDEDVLVNYGGTKAKYGHRQNMDITNPTYRKYAEGVIRALAAHTAGVDNVIGYQLDNETKHYGTAGPGVIKQFREWLKLHFHDIEKLNTELGLAYWSNSAASFEELPDPTGASNGSYACEFSKFQRGLAAEFLRWQSDIVKEYLRPDQFVTQNFDYEWRFFGAEGQQDGFSAGIQPDIDHYEAAAPLTLIGTDIYFFAQDDFTGREIAFGGDEMRKIGKGSYLVLESQAQAFKEWLPYPGQLRQMAWSHIASGACGLLYWHWHSIHNGLETYWKGILSHDFRPNSAYHEVSHIGAEFCRLSPKLTGLKKKNRIAVVVSVEALHALRWSPTDKELCYNDIVRWLYGALYDLNLECDIIYEQEPDWSGYSLLLFPALYTVRPETAARVREFVEQGGTIFATFRSFVANEHTKVFHEPLPYALTDVFGMSYNQWTKPVNVTVDGAAAEYWMELLKPSSAGAAAKYTHKYWGKYAALTRNCYGKGTAWYLGTMVSQGTLKRWLSAVAEDAGIDVPPERWPITVRSAVTEKGQNIRFLFNYSSEDMVISSRWDGTDLLTGTCYQTGDAIQLPDWGVAILEERGKA